VSDRERERVRQSSLVLSREKELSRSCSFSLLLSLSHSITVSSEKELSRSVSRERAVSFSQKMVSQRDHLARPCGTYAIVCEIYEMICDHAISFRDLASL